MPVEPPANSLILVVEDNPTNLLLTSAILRRAGYSIVAAQSAEEAWVCLDKVEPVAILMDIQLPGKDGLTLTREIRANPAKAHIPIIALTANAMQGDAERCRAAGCDEYLTKPVQALALTTTLTRVTELRNRLFA
ncbi:MAG: two-component system, cell cycle response regulator DivK [Chloroflexota bacterium]|nr:two-component system, cell cycle response regulator DivK [Chloroflexota bacterium]